MVMQPFFFQECPTCGRETRIRAEHLGRLVCCNHCQGRFTAADPSLEEDREEPLWQRSTTAELHSVVAIVRGNSR